MSKCFDKLSALARLCHKLLYDLPYPPSRIPLPAFGHLQTFYWLSLFGYRLIGSAIPLRLLPAGPFETWAECKSMDPSIFMRRVCSAQFTSHWAADLVLISTLTYATCKCQCQDATVACPFSSARGQVFFDFEAKAKFIMPARMHNLLRN